VPVSLGAFFPRRVLMTADAVGGVWEYALELGRGLAEVGTEIVLAVMGPPPSDDQRAAARAAGNIDLVVGPYALEWMENPWRDVTAAGDWLLDLQEHRGCDLVHLNGYAHGALPFTAPKIVVGHSCVLSWWQAVKKEAAPPSWDRYQRAVATGLAGADRVVAPTAAMLEALALHYGDLASAEVIPNGRDPAGYQPGDKEPFVLSAGRLWDEAKNAASLARVARTLPWPVKIAGASAPIGAGAGFAAAEDTSAQLLGRLPSQALAALYGQAAIYALPARYEPFGLTVLEAALSECALVLGDIPSLRETWDGVAVFVDPDDDSALEEALLTLMNQPELTAILAVRARERALRYGAVQMVRRYLALYESLVAMRSGGHGKEVQSSCAS
jgi:glycogen synthase